MVEGTVLQHLPHKSSKATTSRVKRRWNTYTLEVSTMQLSCDKCCGAEP